MFKFALLVAAVLNCIFSFSCLDLEGIVNLDAAQVVPSKHTEVRINWGPVLDDIEGDNEFVAKNNEGNIEEDNQQNCKAPNGLGLRNFLKEVEKILPKEQIKGIVRSYAKDPEVIALKNYVSQPKTKEKVKAIRNTQEYQILKDYVCRVLHIDLNEYNKLAKILLKSLLTRADNQPRKGIRGLLRELNGALPRQQIRELYKNLLITDEELVKAVANLKSNEFQQLVSHVKNNVPEYKELRQDLIALGVPIEEIGENFGNVLGWSNAIDSLV